MITVTIQRANGTKVEVPTSQAVLIFQDGDEIGVMGECNGLFLQLIEAGDIIGQAVRKQSAALETKTKPRPDSRYVAVDGKTGEARGAGYWYDDPYAEIDARQKAAYNKRHGADIQLGEQPTYEQLSPEARAAICEKCGVILDPETPIAEGQPVLCGIERCENEPDNCTCTTYCEGSHKVGEYGQACREERSAAK